MLTKKEHHLELHLDQFLMDRESTAFSWGSNDCALFAADAIQAQTGVDIAEKFRGRYRTELGAMKTIKKITGGSTVADAAAYCATKHGMTEYEHPKMAKRGELVIVRNADGNEIAGIVALNGRHVLSPGETGLVRFSILDVTRAWSISVVHDWIPPKWHGDHDPAIHTHKLFQGFTR